MPNRLLKEGITDSDRINRLSAEAEVAFYRLLVVADDLGRMDARISILRARCFPLKEVPGLLAKISSWMNELADASLITHYVVGGQPYLQIENWSQRVRSQGKYPPPSNGQLTDMCPSSVGQSADNSPSESSQLLDTCLSDDGLGLGLGLGRGLGASNANSVRFDAASGNWSVPDLLRSKWGNAYPAVEIDKELASASVWLLANPKNAKSNYARFLTNWLTRAQDKAPRVGGNPSRPGGVGVPFL